MRMPAPSRCLCGDYRCVRQCSLIPGGRPVPALSSGWHWPEPRRRPSQRNYTMSALRSSPAWLVVYPNSQNGSARPLKVYWDRCSRCPTAATPEVGPSSTEYTRRHQATFGSQPSYVAAQATAAGLLAEQAHQLGLTPSHVQSWQTMHPSRRLRPRRNLGSGRPQNPHHPLAARPSNTPHLS